MASKDDQKCSEMCYASENSAPTGILHISVAGNERRYACLRNTFHCIFGHLWTPFWNPWKNLNT